MNNLHEQLNREPYQLSAQEKSRMRGVLLRAMKNTAVPSSYVFHFQRFTAAFAALVIIIAGGGGTVYASQQALPGDLLYPVKINVTEKVAQALATTPDAKAQVAVSIAQERVEEAEALAFKGQLDTQKAQALKESFETQARDASNLTSKVAATDPTAAQEIEAQFTASLGAHSAILAALGEDQKDDTSKKNSAVLSVAVAQQVDTGSKGEDKVRVKTTAATAPVPMTLSIAIEGTTSPSSTVDRNSTSTNEQEDEWHDQANRMKDRASQQLSALRKTLSNSSLDATSTSQFDTSIKESQALIAQGDAQFSTEEYEQAFMSYKQAFQKVVHAQTLLSAQKHFESSQSVKLLIKNLDGGTINL